MIKKILIKVGSYKSSNYQKHKLLLLQTISIYFINFCKQAAHMHLLYLPVQPMNFKKSSFLVGTPFLVSREKCSSQNTDPTLGSLVQTLGKEREGNPSTSMGTANMQWHMQTFQQESITLRFSHPTTMNI